MATRDEDTTDKVLPSSRLPMRGSKEYSAPEPDRGKDKQRSAAEIEQELDAVAQRLAANVDALVDRVHPKRIVGRGAGRARRLVMTSDGRPRAEIVGAVVGALLGVAVLTWWSRAHR